MKQLKSRTAQRLQDLKYVIKESNINSIIRKVARTNKDEIINFKNELKEIMQKHMTTDADDNPAFEMEPIIDELEDLIQEIEQVENGNI